MWKQDIDRMLFVFGSLIIEQCLGRYGLQGIGWYKKSKSDKKSISVY